MSEDDDGQYEFKTVKVIRGMETGAAAKEESAGWQLVAENKGPLRSELTFRRLKRRHQRRQQLTLLGAFLLVITVAIGIGVWNERGKSTNPADSSSEGDTDETSAGTPSETDSEVDEDRNPKYGQTVQTEVRWTCQADPANCVPRIPLEVTVLEPLEFEPSDQTEATQAVNVYFTITIKNKSHEGEFDLGVVTEAGIGDPDHDWGPIYGWEPGIAKAAIKDRRLNSNPCEGTKLPKRPVKLVVPPTTEQVNILKAVVPDRYKALVILAAGTGLRQGEVLGLTMDRLHGVFPAGERTRNAELVVDRQLVRVGSKSPVFGPPKTEASYRKVPLPRVVVDALVEHIQTFGLGNEGLVFSLADGGPISRSTFKAIWAPAARAAGLSAGTGMHALRHYFASLLIRHGESVKTVQARLGHATAGETLDTYSHL